MIMLSVTTVTVRMAIVNKIMFAIIVRSSRCRMMLISLCTINVVIILIITSITITVIVINIFLLFSFLLLL